MYEYGLEKLEHTIDKCSRLCLILEEDNKDIEKIAETHQKLLEEKRKLATDIERLNIRKSNLDSYAEELDVKIDSLLDEVQKFEDESFKQMNLFETKTSKT